MDWAEAERQVDLSPEAGGGYDPAAPLFQHRQGVERALSVWDEGLDIGGLATMVRQEQAAIFKTPDSLLVLVILDMASGEQVGNLVLVTGVKDECFALTEAMILYLRDRGVKRVRTAARCGWLRDERVRSTGWRRKAVLLEREV